MLFLARIDILKLRSKCSFSFSIRISSAPCHSLSQRMIHFSFQKNVFEGEKKPLPFRTLALRAKVLIRKSHQFLLHLIFLTHHLFYA